MTPEHEEEGSVSPDIPQIRIDLTGQPQAVNVFMVGPGPKGNDHTLNMGYIEPPIDPKTDVTVKMVARIIVDATTAEILLEVVNDIVHEKERH